MIAKYPGRTGESRSPLTLQEPLFLLVLVLAPVLMLLYWRREKRTRAGQAAFAAPALMASVVPVRPGWRAHVPLVAYGLALVVLAVALARPQVAVSVEVEQARIVLLTDHSGSMAAKDVMPTRLDAARRAANDFLDDVPESVEVGAMIYNQDPEVLQTPTRDRQAITEALASAEPAGSTATGDALLLALKVAQPAARPGEAPPPAAIILLSDGESVRGSDPLDAAREAERVGVPIYTVALGTPQGRIPKEGRGRSPFRPTRRRWRGSPRSPTAPPSRSGTPSASTRSTSASAVS